MIEFFKANSKKDTFEKIFKGYNDNFRALEEYLKSFGSEIYVEHFTGLDKEVVELEHPYRPNQNQVQVFKNGAVQWNKQGFEEMQGGRSIKVIDVKPSDYIDVVIYQHFNFRSIEGYYMRTYTSIENMVSDSSLNVRQSAAVLTDTRIMFFTIVTGGAGSPQSDGESVYLLDNGNKAVVVQIAVMDVRDLPLASRYTPGLMKVGEGLDVAEQGLVSSTGEIDEKYIATDDIVRKLLDEKLKDK